MTINNQNISIENGRNQWKNIFKLGGVSTIIVLFGVILDIAFGSVTGGNLSALPQTAIDRFAQFNGNPILGLYNLDLLNVIIQIIMIPVYFALYGANRKINAAFALFALVIFLVGTTIFVTANTALPMFELSKKYAVATTESQRILLAAAGEAMLARGAHGSMGVFIGFLLPNLAGIIMSFVMLTGKVFSKTTAYLGIFGSILICIYIVLVTFAPGIKNIATIVSMPGGLLLLVWMILLMVKLFQLGHEKNMQV